VPYYETQTGEIERKAEELIEPIQALLSRSRQLTEVRVALSKLHGLVKNSKRAAALELIEGLLKQIAE